MSQIRRLCLLHFPLPGFCSVSPFIPISSCSSTNCRVTMICLPLTQPNNADSLLHINHIPAVPAINGLALGQIIASKIKSLTPIHSTPISVQSDKCLSAVNSDNSPASQIHHFVVHPDHITQRVTSNAPHCTQAFLSQHHWPCPFLIKPNLDPAKPFQIPSFHAALSVAGLHCEEVQSLTNCNANTFSGSRIISLTSALTCNNVITLRIKTLITAAYIVSIAQGGKHNGGTKNKASTTIQPTPATSIEGTLNLV